MKGHTSWNKGKKLSDTHRKNLSEARKKFFKNGGKAATAGKPSYKTRGDKHYNWKGGVSPKNKIVRIRIEYKLWREAVYSRDDYTCQKCEEKGGYLHPHHILNFSTHLDIRFAIDNGITFCKECHLEFHKIFGYNNNTREQLKEFLSIE